MRTWIFNCLSHHPKCKLESNQRLPRRLLDLRAFSDSEDIRLVVSECITKPADYVALSHCWGPAAKHPICTNTSTLDDRQRRIRFEALSLTFKDAVTVCRQLCYRQLWIDSLCIFQDDTHDWAGQAVDMASIYGNSCVTLAALSTADSTQGC